MNFREIGLCWHMGILRRGSLNQKSSLCTACGWYKKLVKQHPCPWINPGQSWKKEETVQTNLILTPSQGSQHSSSLIHGYGWQGPCNGPNVSFPDLFCRSHAQASTTLQVKPQVTENTHPTSAPTLPYRPLPANVKRKTFENRFQTLSNCLNEYLDHFYTGQV